VVMSAEDVLDAWGQTDELMSTAGNQPNANLRLLLLLNQKHVAYRHREADP